MAVALCYRIVQLTQIIPHFNALQIQGNSLKSPLTLINCKLMDGFSNLLYGLVLRCLSIMDDEFNALNISSGKISTNSRYDIGICLRLTYCNAIYPK